MTKDLYSEPFLTSWPTPLSFSDIKECFRPASPHGKKLQAKLNSDRKLYVKKENVYNANLIKAFWNVFFSPVGFNA